MLNNDVTMELTQQLSLDVYEIYYTTNSFKVMSSTSLDTRYMKKIVAFQLDRYERNR